MAEEEIPRRLRRFQRQKKEPAKKKAEAKPPAGKPRTRKRARTEKKDKKKGPGFLERLFGGKKEKAKERPARTHKPAAAAKPSERDKEAREKEAQRVMTDMRKKLVAQKEETMAQDIYNQIIAVKKPETSRSSSKKEAARRATLKEVREFRRRTGRYPKKHEYEGLVESVFKQMEEQPAPSERMAAGEAKPGTKRTFSRAELRRLERKALTAAAKEEVKAEALKAKPVEEEKPARKGRAKAARKPRARAKKKLVPVEPAPEEDTSALTSRVKELLAEEKLPEEEAGIEPLGDEEGLEELSEVEPIEEERLKKAECPNCHRKTLDIAFCPHCGTAFCKDCALEAKEQAGEIRFKCPNCKKVFKKRKI